MSAKAEFPSIGPSFCTANAPAALARAKASGQTLPRRQQRHQSRAETIARPGWVHDLNPMRGEIHRAASIPPDTTLITALQHHHLRLIRQQPLRPILKRLPGYSTAASASEGST